MKKTLAIVLALVMVLCMIPAMAADSKNIETTHKEVNLVVYNGNATKVLGEAKLANTVTAKYNFEDAAEAPEVETGKWSDKKKMAIVQVTGFDFTDAASVDSVKIDGKELDVDSYAAYLKANQVGPMDNGQVNFPIELTKAGYTDTFSISVEWKDEESGTDGKKIDVYTTEYAKVSVKLQNTASYKGAETAYITNIASTDKDVASAYIVGDKIYIDYVDDEINDGDVAELKITFADENKAAFTGITYAYQPVVKQGSNFVQMISATSLSGKADAKAEVKLDESATKYGFDKDIENQTVKFKLETKAANYETKAYTVKVRTGIKEEDPKGIYFAETTKTIAMGETYAPVVLGVKTGKPVAAELKVGDRTDAQVVDFNKDKNVVIGTREGVAYITASYTPVGMDEAYESSSMKIVVTLPGESIPALDPAAETYYVTCRALNVRAGAGTSYKKVDLIHRGDAVKVVELKNGWAKLADGTWVCAKYISK